MEKTVRTLCSICGYHLLDITVKDNEVVKVAIAPHPINRGDATCIKATKALPWNFREGRVTYPMMRKGKGGPWERVSWDDALDTIAAKLKELRRNYGPEALWIYFASGIILSGSVSMRSAGGFAEAFGTPNVGSAQESCWVPRLVCNFITFGGLLLPDLDPKANPGSLFLWGVNPTASLPPISARILRFKREKGTKIVVVDPRRIPLAKSADIHLQLRPGTDAALALAMINTVIEEEIYDKEFVENYTSGFDKLVEHVKRYKPEFVEDIVGVPASLIKEAARMFAQSKPTGVMRFLGGTETTSNGFDAHRAVDILAAITGNVDNEGGNLVPQPSSGSILNKWSPMSKNAVGFDYHPVFLRIARGSIGACLADAALDGDPYPIKGMIIDAGNPVLMHVNQTRFREVLKKLDFVVQIDVRLNDTSEFADIFLPAKSPLERPEINLGGGWDVQWTGAINKVLEPPGECLADYEIWWKLGEKMGFEVPKSYEEYCNSFLKEIYGITVEDIKENPSSEREQFEREGFERYKKRGFSTPSGKVEIYSTYMEKRGFDPLPSYHEPPESPVSLPSLALKYPLIAIDVRSAHYFHTRYREIPEIRKLSPEPLVDIHPKDAEKYGIANGDLVVMESPRGGMELKARVTDEVREGVVSVEAGWSDPACYNFLTGDDVHQRDPVTGGAMFRAFLCRVSKKGA